jgi:hypothetical protein
MGAGSLKQGFANVMATRAFQDSTTRDFDSRLASFLRGIGGSITIVSKVSRGGALSMAEHSQSDGMGRCKAKGKSRDLRFLKGLLSERLPVIDFGARTMSINARSAVGTYIEMRGPIYPHLPL